MVHGVMEGLFPQTLMLNDSDVQPSIHLSIPLSAYNSNVEGLEHVTDFDLELILMDLS